MVPWLERLDHHYKIFQWDVPTLKMEPSSLLPSSVLDQLRPRRVDARLHRQLRLVGAERIVWACDYPHPDAKIPGVTDELVKAIGSLTPEQQRLIAGGSAETLYDL